MVALHMQLLVILEPLTFHRRVSKFLFAYLVKFPGYSSSFLGFLLVGLARALLKHELKTTYKRKIFKWAPRNIKLISWLLVPACYTSKTHSEFPAKVLNSIGWAGLVNAKTYQLLHPGHSVVLLDQNDSLGGTVRRSQSCSNLLPSVHRLPFARPSLWKHRLL